MTRRYLRFAALDYHRIYGLRLARRWWAVLVGFVASLLG